MLRSPRGRSAHQQGLTTSTHFLLEDNADPTWYGSYSIPGNLPFDDEFLIELAESKPLQRLKRIGFLGAVDLLHRSSGPLEHHRCHNRYEHSIGVASLGLLYARICGLSNHDTRVLAGAGLLHDIGHGPFSHTLESIFKQKFGITHHSIGADIVRGKLKIGTPILNILKCYRIDPDEILSMIDGKHSAQYAFLFASPINLDTIEAITRCSRIIDSARSINSEMQIVTNIAQSNGIWPTKILDSFWNLKHEVYTSYIHDPRGRFLDGLMQSYFVTKFNDLELEDFLCDEDTLQKKYGEIFAASRRVGKFAHLLRKENIWDTVKGQKIQKLHRVFFVDESVNVEKISDLWRRYRQKKECTVVTVQDLISEMEESCRAK